MITLESRAHGAIEGGGTLSLLGIEVMPSLQSCDVSRIICRLLVIRSIVIPLDRSEQK